jgi:hypothetical protein
MHRRLPIGKLIGGSIYVHRDYVDRVVPGDIFREAKKIGHIKDFHEWYPQWTIVKWNKYKEMVSFVYCPYFDRQFEPGIHHVVTVDLRTRTSQIRCYRGIKNRPIYHYKWLMVGVGYRKFQVSQCMMRSYEIERVLKKYNINRSKIGYRRYWDDVVIPLIQKERIPDGR